MLSQAILTNYVSKWLAKETKRPMPWELSQCSVTYWQSSGSAWTGDRLHVPCLYMKLAVFLWTQYVTANRSGHPCLSTGTGGCWLGFVPSARLADCPVIRLQQGRKMNTHSWCVIGKTKRKIWIVLLICLIDDLFENTAIVYTDHLWDLKLWMLRHNRWERYEIYLWIYCN